MFFRNRSVVFSSLNPPPTRSKSCGMGRAASSNYNRIPACRRGWILLPCFPSLFGIRHTTGPGMLVRNPCISRRGIEHCPLISWRPRDDRAERPSLVNDRPSASYLPRFRPGTLHAERFARMNARSAESSRVLGVATHAHPLDTRRRCADDRVMILRTPITPPLDTAALLIMDDHASQVWSRSRTLYRRTHGNRHGFYPE